MGMHHLHYANKFNYYSNSTGNLIQMTGKLFESNPVHLFQYRGRRDEKAEPDICPEHRLHCQESARCYALHPGRERLHHPGVPQALPLRPGDLLPELGPPLPDCRRQRDHASREAHWVQQQGRGTRHSPGRGILSAFKLWTRNWGRAANFHQV